MLPRRTSLIDEEQMLGSAFINLTPCLHLAVLLVADVVHSNFLMLLDYTNCRSFSISVAPPFLLLFLGKA